MSNINDPSPIRRRPRRHEENPAGEAIGFYIATAVLAAGVLAMFGGWQIAILLTPVVAAIFVFCLTKRRWLKVLLGGLVAAGFLTLFLPAAGAIYIGESLISILVGWGYFLNRTLRHVTVSGVSIATFFALLVLMTVAVHMAMKWAMRRSPTESATKNRWSTSQSVRVVCLFAITFVSGLGFVGVVHQSGWLMSSMVPTLDYQDGGMFNRERLHDIGGALYDARDPEGRFSFGVMDEEDQPLHSWQTMLLPYLDQQQLFHQIDLRSSWRAPGNREPFVQPIDVFQSRKFDREEVISDGYSVSHFSANSRVIRLGRGMTVDEMTDGAANTILAGEVGSRFRAWGDPFNIRDPAVGLNHPDGFATPWDSGNSRLGIFLMADGRVQSIHDDIDADVFRALATPDAGDDAGEF